MSNPAYTPPDSTPIHVTAVTTIQSNTSAGVNTISLRNPLEAPMEILEIKWQLHIEGTAQLTGNALGGIVGCKLDLGKIPLTNGFVPVWSFGRCVNYNREQNYYTHNYTWRLPRPLFVPAGAAVIPTFQHRGLLTNSVVTRISYAGRSLPAGFKPKRLDLPYASFFATKNYFSSVSGSDSSTETDLMNPFSEPLKLQAFTGRVMALRSDLIATAQEGSNPIFGSQALTLRMRDSNGRPIVKNSMPFSAAFTNTLRAWEGENFTMNGKSFYLVDTVFTQPGSTGGNPDYIVQGFIGVVGHREVAV